MKSPIPLSATVLSLLLVLTGCGQNGSTETGATPTTSPSTADAVAVAPLPSAPPSPAPSDSPARATPPVPPSIPASEVPPAPAAATLRGAATNLAAGLWGNLTGAVKTPSAATNRTAPTNVSSQALADALPLDTISQGLRQALGKGLDHAVKELGRNGGFLSNVNVRIPVPETLRTAEKALRTIGQGRLADEFVTTLNRAAEQAVPAAAPVFADALRQMTLKDAQSLLNGPADAATQYFRKTTEAQLREKFQPIVREATTKAGVTAAFKQVADRAKFAAPLVSRDAVDLDSYVTTKSLDGLFLMVAEQEKRIRENPAARTTELLKSVFGRFAK